MFCNRNCYTYFKSERNDVVDNVTELLENDMLGSKNFSSPLVYCWSSYNRFKFSSWIIASSSFASSATSVGKGARRSMGNDSGDGTGTIGSIGGG